VFSGTTGAAPSGAADSGVGFAELAVTFAGLDIPGGTTGLAQGDGSTTALGDISYAFTAGSPPTLSLDGGPPQAVNGGIQSFTVGNGNDTVSLDVTVPITPASGTFTSRANLSTDGGQSTLLVDDFSGAANYQVRNSYDGTVVNVDASGLARTGTERVKFEGTFDPFTALIEIRDILHNESGVSDEEVSSRLTEVLGEIGSAHDSILGGLQELGSRSNSLDLFENRLGDLELARQGSLSEVEDVDFSEAVIELNRQELAFQASLQVGARAVQTTLLNYL
jgi:flagellin-like hook-associated protein FlgL